MKRSDIPDEAANELARILQERAGLKSAPDGINGLKLAIAARLEATGGTDPIGYVRALGGGNEDELRALLPLVTVGKTDFFRDPNQFRALRLRLFPELLQKARRAHRQVRIWSAGCATGEEPYSLAMLAMEQRILHNELDLLATDVNPEAVKAAARGRFSERRLAPVPEAVRAQHFIERADGFYASTALRSMIRFAPHNLAADPFPEPAGGGKWDLVLCRNVIIYFDAATTTKVMSGFFDMLAPGGYLLLGYSESLYRIFSGFELVELEGAFLYRKPLDGRREAPRAPFGEESIAALRKVIDARRSMQPPKPPQAERTAPPPVARVLPPPPARLTPPPSSTPIPKEEPMAQIVAAIDHGEFDRAVELLHKALQRSPGNLALQVTLGNVYTVMGKRDLAREAYQEALVTEPLCPEAHLFLGISSCEVWPDREQDALRELTRAVFLDPDLALAHYYLGRLAERRGDLAGARRAYRNAISACKARPEMRLIGHYPDLPSDSHVLSRAAHYALAAVEEL